MYATSSYIAAVDIALPLLTPTHAGLSGMQPRSAPSLLAPKPRMPLQLADLAKADALSAAARPPRLDQLHRLCLEIHGLPVHQMDAGLSHLLMRLGTLLDVQRVECTFVNRCESGRQRTQVWRSWAQEGKGHQAFDQTLIQVAPLSDAAQAVFYLKRTESSPEFDPQVHVWLSCALAALSRWLQWLALSHGVVGSGETLSIQQRRVLLSILSGLTEKQIANQLRLNIHTVHNTIICLYRRFGVRNRSSLTALWLEARSVG